MARNRLYLDPNRDYEDETMLKQLLNPYKDQALDADRKSVVQGKSGDLGGRRNIKKEKEQIENK